MNKELKTQKNGASVKVFLDAIDDEQKRKDAFELLVLFNDATGESAKMWGSSIVGFGDSSYRRADGSEHQWMLTGFSPRKASLTLYIMTGFDEYAEASGYNPKPLLDNLGPHKTGKSCLYIKRLEDVDKSVLEQLIKTSIEVQKKNGGTNA